MGITGYNNNEGNSVAILEWLKRRTAGDDAAVLQIETHELEFSGLNIRQVLDAHQAWKVRLLAVLDKTSTESLQVSEIQRDNVCILGKWIHGAAKPLYGRLPEYESLRQTHAAFHLAAGDVLRRFLDGNPEAARKLLRAEFSTLSDRIQLDLVRLYASKTG